MRKMMAVAQMRKMMNGFWTSQAIFVAAKLGIADHLAHGEQDSDILAASVGAHPAALYRLLRVLTSLGILSETSSRKFTLTTLAECLRSDHPESVRSWAISMGELAWKPWGELLHCINTGQSAFHSVYGLSRYAYLEAHSEQAAWFNHAMSIFSADLSKRIGIYYAGSLLGKIVDVGGGQGTLLAALLHANQESSGILLERTDVIAKAQALMDGNGLSGRCRCIAGDFLVSVPEGADTYILSSILHNWDDETATTILRNCRRAINASGKILIIDYVLEPDSKPHANLLDLHMLVMHGGQERTPSEFINIITAAGLRLERIIPISESCIIECRY